MDPLAIIVAYARDRVIGWRGGMPWHEPEDLAHFKAMSMGHPVILGRKSFTAIGRVLPGRLNLIVSRQTGLVIPGAEVCHDLPTAIARAREVDDLPFICGGAGIYAAALPLTTVLHLTEIDRAVPGDAFFPAVDESAWVETWRRVSGPLTFRTLRRSGDDHD
jgi:dihydrofolate reductase